MQQDWSHRRRAVPPSPHMYVVYVLQSRKDSGFYIGTTSDLEKRLKEHNSGKTRSLRHRLPVELVYHEKYAIRHEAKAREQQLKSWKGSESFKQLVEGSPRRWRGSNP